MAKEKAQGTEVVNPQPSQELEVPKARVLAEVFAPNGKIRVELLPEGAGGSAEGGSVDLQPLEKRVAALEAKPEAEHVDLNPLSERVAALENAPKVADKSQEVTALQGEVSTLQGGISTLQGTVAEHTTSIASNVQRITALESKPAPEGANLQPLTARVEALEDGANLGVALLGRCLVSEIPYWIENSESLKGIFDSLLNRVAQLGGAVLLKNPEASLSPYNEHWLVFQLLSDGTLYRINMDSKTVDASEATFPDNDVLYTGPDTKFFKAELLGRIPGIPGTYTIREDYYIDPRPYQSDTYRMEPSTRRQLEPVADQIKKLLGLS